MIRNINILFIMKKGEKCYVYSLRSGSCLFQELLTIIQPKPVIDINQNRKRRKMKKNGVNSNSINRHSVSAYVYHVYLMVTF